MADKSAIGTLLIHGIGLIGGSLGLAALSSGLADVVVGVGRERDVEQLELAVRLGAITRYELSGQDETGLYDACAEADLIALCTPVAAISRSLPGVLASASSDAVVTDVGSVKGPILQSAAGDPRFVGSHPITGSERSGVGAARADLFRNASWAIVADESASAHAVETIEYLVSMAGAIPHRIDARRHDEAVALTSHLPHVIAYTLMALAGDQHGTDPELPCLAAGSFAGATRVAGSLPSLWREIAAQNQTALSDSLRAYRARLEFAQSYLDNGDFEALEEIFDAGFQARRLWMQRQTGS